MGKFSNRLQQIVQWTIVVALLFALTSCGFHLRGSIENQNNTQVYFPTKTIEHELNQIISSYLIENERLATDAQTADQTLKIISGEWQKRIASVGDDGVAAEYTLYYRVRFSLTSTNKQLSNQLISVHQDYSYNRAQLLSVDSEEAQIKRSLTKQMAYRLIQLLNLSST